MIGNLPPTATKTHDRLQLAESLSRIQAVGTSQHCWDEGFGFWISKNALASRQGYYYSAGNPQSNDE
jgi:hypothetical protein